jgi:hypothetical protein
MKLGEAAEDLRCCEEPMPFEISPLSESAGAGIGAPLRPALRPKSNRRRQTCSFEPKRTCSCCLWCASAFTARRGGKEQRFCSGPCRTAFHSACRNWAVQAVYDGRVSVDAIRNAPQATCTLILGPISGVAAREVAGTHGS